MKVNSKQSDAEFELCPEGSAPMRCYRFIDLGTQDVTYKGETKKTHKCLISFELPTKLMSDGRPFTVHKRFTLSFNPKASLAKFLKSWAPSEYKDGIDLEKLIIKRTGLGNIVHETGADGNVYTNLSTIMPLPEGTSIPDCMNDQLFFELCEGAETGRIDDLSLKLQDTIRKSPEWKQVLEAASNKKQTKTSKTNDDEIPF